MSAPIEIDALDLAALISSRLCHDVISPVGAIVNGLEVLEEDDDPQMREFALDLIKKSARQASARLQFARLAFGAAGSAGAAIDLGDAEQVARGAIHDNKTELRWNLPRAFLPKNQVKLLLNLLVIAVTTIPRGGVITVDGVVEGETGSFRITSTGTSARIPANVPELLRGVPPEGRVDAHVIQPFYTGLIARAADMTVAVAMDGEASLIVAAPAAAVGEAETGSTDSVTGESVSEDGDAPRSL